MIVRVMGVGQFRLEGDSISRLNELDDRAQEALERDDESELDRELHQLTSQGAVDDDLARLKAELGQGAPPQQSLESGEQQERQT